MVDGGELAVEGAALDSDFASDLVSGLEEESEVLPPFDSVFLVPPPDEE